MSRNRISRSWGAAIEDTMTEEGREAPVAEFHIDVAETSVDEDGAPLEAVDASGEPTLDAMEPEIMEAEEEVEDAQETVEQLDKTAETMESYRAIIESRIASGQGMTAGELEFMKAGIAGRIKLPRDVFPSAESFSYNPLSASTEALESIKSGIAEIWRKIVDAIKSLFAKVKNWWLKTLDAAPRLKKRAEAIAKKAQQTQGTMAEKKFSFSSNRSICNENGKAYTDGNTAAGAIGDVADIVSVCLNTIGDIDTKCTEKTEQNLGALIKAVQENDAFRPANNDSGTNSSKNTVTTAVDGLVGGLTAAYDSVTGANGTFSKDLGDSRYTGIKGKGTKTLPGLKRFAILAGLSTAPTHETKTGDISKHWRNVGLTMFTVDLGKNKSIEGTVDYPTLTTSQVQDVCGSVITIADAIIAYRKGWEDRDKAVKEALKAIDREVKDVDKSDDINKQGRTILSSHLTGFRNYTTRTLDANTQAIGYFMNTSKVFLLYCTRSLAQHKR